MYCCIGCVGCIAVLLYWMYWMYCCIGCIGCIAVLDVLYVLYWIAAGSLLDCCAGVELSSSPPPALNELRRRNVNCMGKLPDEDCYATLEMWNPVKFHRKITEKFSRPMLISTILHGFGAELSCSANVFTFMIKSFIRGKLGQVTKFGKLC